MFSVSELNNNPRAKLQKLRELLQTPGITSIQQARIFKLIQETESLVANSTSKSYSGPSIPRGNPNLYPHQPPQTPQPNYQQQPTSHQTQQRQEPPKPSIPHSIPSYMARTAGAISGMFQTAGTSLALVPTQQPLKNHGGSGAGAGEMSRFETDEQIREREFEEEMNRKKHEFRRQQEQRRQEYLNKLQEMESGNVDSLRLLGLNTNYTIEELKSAYKRMAMETHPDRPGGNTEKFQLVTQCYMSLLERLKGQTPAKSAMDLRAESRGSASRSSNDWIKDVANELTRQKQKKTPAKFINPDGQGFNVKLFNKLYEENKIWDPNDDGYEDWLRKGDVDEIRKAPPVFSKSFNIGVFNSTFEDWKQQTKQGGSGGVGGQIQKYDRPQELISTSSGYTVLDGGEPIRDFTKSLDTPGALNYSDLKSAYTGGCDMIDPNSVEARREYRNVEELIRDRDRLDYVLTPEDAALEERYAREAERREQERLSRLSSRDNLVGQHYSQTHERLIGRAPDSDNPAALTYQANKNNHNPNQLQLPLPPAAGPQLQYHQQRQATNMLTSARAPSITSQNGAGMGRLPPPVSPAAIAAATGQQQPAALTYVAQANNLRARSNAR
jgi:hypothetical protein